MPSETAPNDTNSEADHVSLSDMADAIDRTVFDQILEMDDDDEDREFSKSIVFGFFEQAEQTFTDMDDALEAKDLAKLSSLGHFLKGSSATLGLTKVKDSCEKIQHFGQKRNAEGTDDEPDEEKCLKLISESLVAVKSEYKEAEGFLRKFFADP